MKLYLTKLPPFGYNSNELFTVGKWYEGELTPTIYDPQTLQPTPASYIDKCNDSNFRKVSHEYFISLEEFRERQLKELSL